MNRIFFLPLACFFFLSIVLGQPPSSEATKLNQQMTALFEQGKLDEAADLAEKIVKMAACMMVVTQGHGAYTQTNVQGTP